MRQGDNGFDLLTEIFDQPSKFIGRDYQIVFGDTDNNPLGTVEAVVWSLSEDPPPVGTTGELWLIQKGRPEKISIFRYRSFDSAETWFDFRMPHFLHLKELKEGNGLTRFTVSR